MNISSSQAQIQAAGVIDANGNGAGEYGYFQELSGARNVKTGVPGVGSGVTVSTVRVQPPVLSGAFGKVDTNGRVLRSGYFFQNLSTVHRDDIRLRSEISLPSGNGRISMVDVEDVAEGHP